MASSASLTTPRSSRKRKVMNYKEKDIIDIEDEEYEEKEEKSVESDDSFDKGLEEENGTEKDETENDMANQGKRKQTGMSSTRNERRISAESRNIKTNNISSNFSKSKSHPMTSPQPQSQGVRKRKEVKIAKDSQIVLAKCRALRDQMKKEVSNNANNNILNDTPNNSITKFGNDMINFESSDEDWSYKEGKATPKQNKNKNLSTRKNQKKSQISNTTENLSTSKQIFVPAGFSASTLDSLKDKQIVEVSEMNATNVANEIENIAIGLAQQIISGKGFTMEIPSRAAGNQIYVPELDRIVLGDKKGSRSFLNVKEARKSAITTRVLQLLHTVLLKRIHITKRDLFYTDVKLFIDQNESDGVLDDVATMIGCTRSNLHVVASDKGLVVGRISFYEDGDFIDCTRMGVGGKAIPPYIDKIEDIQSDAEFILLVEKEAAYMRMAEDRFYHKYPCIVITAKGQPDVASRMFLSRIREELQIPVLGLVDSDPYGLKILSVYMSGSKNMSYDSASLTTPDIKWLGLRPSDLDVYDLPDQCRLDMTESDIKTGKELMKEDFIAKNPKWMKELEIMVKTKKKAEIQALSSFGFQYITEQYLPRKLREGDWI